MRGQRLGFRHPRVVATAIELDAVGAEAKEQRREQAIEARDQDKPGGSLERNAISLAVRVVTELSWGTRLASLAYRALGKTSASPRLTFIHGK